MQKIYSEKEVLADGLCAQKGATSLFDKAANECVHDQFRETIFNILEDEHRIQVEVFDLMHRRGFYETPSTDQQKIQQAKQKFAKAFQQV